MALFGGKKVEHFDGLLGIDVGHSGVKVVELIVDKGQPRLSTYGYAEFNDPGQPFLPLADLDRSAKLIRSVLERAGTRATRTVAALPSAEIFQTVLTIAAPKNKEEIKGLVEAQAAKLLPLPLGEMMIDSTVIDKDGVVFSDHGWKFTAGSGDLIASFAETGF